jgi:hypothetical protein
VVSFAVVRLRETSVVVLTPTALTFFTSDIRRYLPSASERWGQYDQR